MAGIIGNAMSGLGEGMSKVGDYLMRSSLQEQAEKAVAQRDITLAALREKYDIAADERKRAPGIRAAEKAKGLISGAMSAQNAPVSEEAGGVGPTPDASLPLSESKRLRIMEEAYAGEGLTQEAESFRRSGTDQKRLDMEEQRLVRQDEDRDLDRADRRADRDANERYRQDSLKIQRQQIAAANDRVTLQPMGDGRIMRVTKDGKSAGFLMDPDTNKPLIGPKDVAQSAQLLIKGNNEIITGLLKDGGPEQLKRAEELRAENRRLSGLGGEQPGGSQPYADGTELKGKDGKIYVVQNGAPVLKEGPASTAATTPAPRSSAPARAMGEEYIKQGRGGTFIDAPPRSPAAALKGRTFSSREDALAALAELFN